MRVMRKLVIPAIAAGAIMAGAPAALAATSSAAASAHAATPALGPWTYYSNYPTQAVCNGAGDYLEVHDNIFDFKCVQVELDGYTTVWDLYFRII